jgi:hypothetical protein
MKRLLILLALLCLAPLAQAQEIVNTGAKIFQPTAMTAATVNSNDQFNPNSKGLHLIVNVTSFTSGSYTPHIQGEDPANPGVYYDILVGAAITATGTTVLKVYPGIGTLANGATSDLLPLTWRVQLIGASTPSMTLSVSANLER